MASTEPHPSAPADGTEVIVVREAPTGPELLDVPAAPSLAARLGAEAFGAFGLILTIIGAALYLPVSGAQASLGVPLAAGLVLAGLIAALGPVSGGHFNPAVSLGAALTGRLSFVELLLYWLSQVVGGLAAAAILFVTLPTGVTDARGFFTSTANGWGTHSPLSSATQGAATFDLKAALILEAVATAVFVAVTIGVAARRFAPSVGPFAVGFTLSAMLVVTGIATGGGLNPARSTASALFSQSTALGQLWLFWLAPLLGAAIVGLFAMAFAPAAPEPFMAEEYEEDLDDEDEDDEGEDDEVDEIERV